MHMDMSFNAIINKDMSMFVCPKKYLLTIFFFCKGPSRKNRF